MARKTKPPPTPERLSKEQVLQKCLHYASLAVSLNKEELVELGAFAYSVSAVQEQLLIQFLAEHASGPLLVQYSQDTTPVSRRKPQERLRLRNEELCVSLATFSCSRFSCPQSMRRAVSSTGCIILHQFGFGAACQHASTQGKLGDYEQKGLCPKSVLAFVLENPRLARHQDRLWQESCQEHQHLQALPLQFWAMPPFETKFLKLLALPSFPATSDLQELVFSATVCAQCPPRRLWTT